MSSEYPGPRYALFAGSRFEKGGGYHDFKGRYALMADAKVEGEKLLTSTDWRICGDWFHIVNLETNEIVLERSKDDE